MGATNSHIKTNVKQQTVAESRPLYKLVNLEGGGELIDLAKTAIASKDLTKLDHAIKQKVQPYLYYGGKGRLIEKTELVTRRRSERSKLISRLAKFESGNEIDEKSLNEFYSRPRGLLVSGSSRSRAGQSIRKIQASVNNPRMLHRVLSAHDKEELMTSMKYKYPEDADKYRFCCWDIDKRGTVGETILHLCLLNGSSLHINLAKRLIQIYPNLAKDIYIGDEYYGEGTLHMAIVSESPAMLKMLLDCGPSLYDRACGNFFCADDQKDERNDYSDYEWIALPKKTSHIGKVYWGEYPLSFAACLNQEECVRLLLAHGADPNRQDANGNTALHMLVVQNNTHMFDLLHELGADINIRNRQGLSPFTLSAHIGNLEMYEHILKIKRSICWSYGDVVCAGYPLSTFDTIGPKGEIDENSALYKIVHGCHLNMLDGLVTDLLAEKWKTFVAKRLLLQFIWFLLYIVLFTAAMYIRPGDDNFVVQSLVNGTTGWKNVTIKDKCYLYYPKDTTAYARIVIECLVVVIAISQILYQFLVIYQNSFRLYINTIAFAPTKALFLLGCVLVVIAIPGRFACYFPYEDTICTISIVLSTPHFLFFLRGFKYSGPSVVMFYKMIKGDLIRFALIYFVFLIGFSQALYICFRLVTEETQFNHPLKAIMGTIIITLSEFQELYEQFELSPHHLIAKALFIFNLIISTILLVNMLIAMMGQTFNIINDQDREWIRQYSQIVLVVEFSVSAEKRLSCQKQYSQPLGEDGKDGRQFVIRWQRTEEEQIEDKLLREQHRLHQKNEENLLLNTPRHSSSVSRTPSER
ncbi:transient receptor potential cation channel subfamily V member 5-like isoform X2 [Tubulanus polymorphus]|uniref:transient receptor potential cation channel subfamily V member 5-like isoform X2 n=1 Tax=Tubulanus polymorphus TaxID=672921 RepID=UPI003DA4D570